jgi:hypothetical protein
MKKLLLSAFIGSVSAVGFAQTAVGTYVNDFTLTDINGTVHHLYDYTDAGKMVVIDVSATWCGPCWDYHGTGALNDFYLAHGPSGANDAMVLFVEGDPSTNSADLNGTGSNTQGDWVTGENMPIIDLTTSASFENSGMDIAYFPVMYVICPNRTILKSGTAGSIGTLSLLNSYVGDCPAVASSPNDAAILSYQGETKDCSPVDLTVKLQNNGTAPLTSATITATVGGSQVASYNWSGNLGTYDAVDVTIGQYLPVTTGDLVTFAITGSDASAANNTLSKTIGKASTGASNNITVKVSLDRWGSETSWKIRKGSGAVAYSSPAYTDAASNGTYPQPDINIILPDDCYTLEVLDSYGDGFDGSYGNGLVQVYVNGTSIGGVTNFTGSEDNDKFQLEAVAGLQELGATAFNVFPNPASDILNVSFEAVNTSYSVQLTDIQGREIMNQEFSGLQGTQNITLPVADLSKGSYMVNVTSLGVTRSQHVVIK